jgi:hypothetical protein
VINYGYFQYQRASRVTSTGKKEKEKRIVARFKEIVWQFHQCHLISSSTVQQISSSELGAECWFCDVADSVIGKE